MTTTSKETVEEAAEKYATILQKKFKTDPFETTYYENGFIAGAKWQSEQQPKEFSREDMWKAYRAANTIWKREQEKGCRDEFEEWMNDNYPAK